MKNNINMEEVNIEDIRKKFIGTEEYVKEVQKKKHWSLS